MTRYAAQYFAGTLCAWWNLCLQIKVGRKSMSLQYQPAKHDLFLSGSQHQQMFQQAVIHGWAK